MHRVAVIVSTFLLLVGAAAVLTYRVGGDAARLSGHRIYWHRHTVINPMRATSSRPPQVVWVGDSTTMGIPSFPSYIDTVLREVLVPAGWRSVTLEGPGLDFYGYWSVAGRIAAWRPTLVILIANLRTLDPVGGPQGFNDLTGEIDLADLPATLALPYYIRGMTAPRLLLARALRTELGEDAFLRFEGVHRIVQEAPAWDVLGPAERPRTAGDVLAQLKATERRILASFDRPVGPDDPMVRFAAATVSRLARGGSAVLVVVTPIPWESCLEVGHYEPGRFLGRIAMLRAVVERHGGQLLDLHRALARAHFRDADCHFTTAGAAEMAKLVGGELRRLLAARPRSLGDAVPRGEPD